MKKLILSLGVLACTLGGASAQHSNSAQDIINRLLHDDEALSILLDTRFDFRTVPAGSEDNDEYGFQGHTLKLWVAGEIVPGIRYRVRHRLNKPQDTLRDNLSGATDQAWVAFDFGGKRQFTATVGKQSVQFGTFEYDYNPADIYLGTMAFNDLDAYKTGVNFAWRFCDQALNIQIVNSDAPQFAADNYSSKALAYNALWEGNLFKGLIKTRWGFGTFQHNGSKYYNWITPGVQLNLGDFTTEFDYYYGYRDMTLEIDGMDMGTHYVKDQSASINLKYNFGKWRPFVKGVFNDRYDNGAKQDAYRNWGVQAVVEFYPFEKKLLKDLRFHLAYAYSDTDYRGAYSGIGSRDQHMITAGMRWLFKVK